MILPGFRMASLQRIPLCMIDPAVNPTMERPCQRISGIIPEISGNTTVLLVEQNARMAIKTTAHLFAAVAPRGSV
jgi:ABC-type branched-subunit amino acid transport system ATPase component